MATVARKLLAVGLLAALGLGACKTAEDKNQGQTKASPSASAPSPAAYHATRPAVIQVLQEPDSLNPFLSPMVVTSALTALFYNGLCIATDQGRWDPDLAEAVPTLQNGGVKLAKGKMRVTYHLRKGVKWHDGQPLTAADVRATWALMRNPRFPAVSRAGYEAVSQVETPNATTATLVFERPYAPYLELFPFVLPAHVISTRAEPARDAWNRAPIGTGPFRFERWVSGDRIVAAANPAFFRGKPGIDKLEVRFIPNEATAYQLWRLGELDLLQGAPATAYDALQREAQGRIFLTTSGTWEHLTFNLERPLVADVRVRRAIAHLINRQQLNSLAYGGVMQPAFSELLPDHWAYNRAVEHAYAPDAVKAKALLEEAGWKVGPDGIRQKAGQRLSLQLVTTSDRPARALAAQLWHRQWRDAGIDVTIEKLPASVVFGAAGGRLAGGRFDLALVASTARPDPDTSFRWRSDQLPPAGQNRARYRNPAMDRLLDQGMQTIDPAARTAIYRKVAAQLSLDLPVIPLLYWVGIDATSPRLHGFRPNPTIRGNLWNAWAWKLDPS